MPALADLCELIIDCEHKTAPTCLSGFPLIRTPDIGFGRLDVEGANRVDEATYRAWTQRAVPMAGDLILAREAPVGNVGPVPPGVQPVLGQRTVLIRTRPEVLDPIYLNYLLCGPELRNWMLGVSSGATLPHLNMADIRSMELSPLPSLDAQRKIATILAAYDELIDNNDRRIKILEEVAQRIYREWFVDFRYPGHGSAPLVASELGQIPLGWAVEPVGNVVAVLGGGTPSKQVVEYWEPGTITWFTPTDLTSTSAMVMSESKLRISELGLAKSSARLFAPGAVMMTSRATIGVVSIATVPAATNQGFITCLPNDLVGPYHLYFWLLDQRTLVTSLASGATFKEINKTTFRAIPFLRAPSSVERRFEDLTEPFIRRIENLLSAQRALRKSRDLLLGPLVSGDIDIADLDIDLPDLAA